MTGSRSRRILWMLAAATIVPLAVLSWLGLKVLEQDRIAERQRRLDALEISAQRLAVDLERWLQEVGARIAPGQTVQLLPTGLVAPPDARLLYQPFVPATPPVQALPFRDGEAAEHQRHDFRAAARAYATVAESRDPHARAQALLGLSRVLRKSGNRAAHFNPKTNQVTFGVGAGIQFEVWKMENFLPASSSQQ